MNPRDFATLLRTEYFEKGGGRVECSEEAPCEAEGCQTCCPHDERDHGICMDCEHDANGDPVAMAKSKNE